MRVFQGKVIEEGESSPASKGGESVDSDAS